MKRKRIMGIGFFIVTFALLGILDYVFEAKGIVITPYSLWEIIHFSVFWTGLGVSAGLYLYPGSEEFIMRKYRIRTLLIATTLIIFVSFIYASFVQHGSKYVLGVVFILFSVAIWGPPMIDFEDMEDDKEIEK